MFQLATFAMLAIVLSLGTFIQSASGFAAGLLIMSILVWLGHPIPEAQIALLIATIPQNVWGVWSFRDAIEPKRLLWPAVGRLGFLPLGIATLWWMDTLPPVRIKQVVGGLLLVITLTIVFLRVSPRERLHPAWSWLAFPASGFLQGLVGMGGPAMVLWVQAHDWDTRRSRGFLFAMYLISLFPAMAMISWTFGRRVGPAAIMALLLMPLLLAVTNYGLRAGTWLGRKRLRRLTIALLIFVATMSLLSPLF
jgi:uncharacterized membrane protein YfcA